MLARRNSAHSARNSTSFGQDLDFETRKKKYRVVYKFIIPGLELLGITPDNFRVILHPCS
jgi:hypothetical protein